MKVLPVQAFHRAVTSVHPLYHNQMGSAHRSETESTSLMPLKHPKDINYKTVYSFIYMGQIKSFKVQNNMPMWFT